MYSQRLPFGGPGTSCSNREKSWLKLIIVQQYLVAAAAAGSYHASFLHHAGIKHDTYAKLALHYDTKQLPMVEAETEFNLPGT